MSAFCALSFESLNSSEERVQLFDVTCNAIQLLEIPARKALLYGNILLPLPCANIVFPELDQKPVVTSSAPKRESPLFHFFVSRRYNLSELLRHVGGAS
jgi:hypothetical protein